MSDRAKKQIKQIIRLAIEITGARSPRQFALKAKMEPSTISRALEETPRNTMSLSKLQQIYDYIESYATGSAITEKQREIYENQFIPLKQEIPGANMRKQAERTDDKPSIERSSVEFIEPPRKHLSDYHMDPRSIPVLGTAAGSALGSFEIGTEAIDYVRRPSSLAGLKQIYAIYVKGESMVPEHNPGDLRIIHPDRPPQPGDSVVIQTYNAATDTREAFIKRLISMNQREVHCYQHNPHMEITYIRPNGNPDMNDTDDTYAIKVHKVLTQNELHGF